MLLCTGPMKSSQVKAYDSGKYHDHDRSYGFYSVHIIICKCTILNAVAAKFCFCFQKNRRTGNVLKKAALLKNNFFMKYWSPIWLPMTCNSNSMDWMPKSTWSPVCSGIASRKTPTLPSIRRITAARCHIIVPFVL